MRLHATCQYLAVLSLLDYKHLPAFTTSELNARNSTIVVSQCGWLFILEAYRVGSLPTGSAKFDLAPIQPPLISRLTSKVHWCLPLMIQFQLLHETRVGLADRTALLELFKRLSRGYVVLLDQVSHNARRRPGLPHGTR